MKYFCQTMSCSNSDQQLTDSCPDCDEENAPAYIPSKELEKEITDTDRINWLESNKVTTMNCSIEGWWCGKGLKPLDGGEYFKTPREAIDAGMKEEK